LNLAGNSAGTAGRGPGRPFAPGVSGNPSGRPRLPPALRKVLPDAIEELAALCKNADASIRLRAVERVIAWNIGQPGVAESYEPDDLAAWLTQVLVAHDLVLLKKAELTREQLEAHDKKQEKEGKK